MVKKLCFLFLLSAGLLYTETYTLTPNSQDNGQEKKINLLQVKIKALIGDNAYARHVKFIKIIFSDEEAYYTKDRVDVAKVIQTLKDNCLLELFFKKPQEMHLPFNPADTRSFL